MPARSAGAWDRAWDNAKLAFPGAAGRERQRPGDKNGRALVDPLESGFGERHRLDRGEAAAFVDRAKDLMRGGRPICPLCSGPIDPGGHACPRSNGHVVSKA